MILYWTDCDFLNKNAWVRDLPVWKVTEVVWSAPTLPKNIIKRIEWKVSDPNEMGFRENIRKVNKLFWESLKLANFLDKGSRLIYLVEKRDLISLRRVINNDPFHFTLMKIVVNYFGFNLHASYSNWAKSIVNL